MDIIPICFHRPHDIAGATIQSTLSTHLSVKKAENDNVQKPTIFDIINETEKNQTIINQSIGRFVPQADAKVVVGHPGVAEPLTWQQLERELANDQKLRDSSTSKEGISTWILLSGSDQTQPASSPTPSATTIAAQVDKLEIQVPSVTTEPPRRNNFRFQESQQSKLDKIGKIRQAIERRKGMPEKKNKPAGSSSTSTSTTTESIELNKPTAAINETKFVRRKNPSFVQISKNNKRKPGSSTTTTTSDKPHDEEMTTIVSYIHGLYNTEEESGETTTPVPFLVLEPKDADFDLPQDRSPGHPTKKPKRPAVGTKTKKKNGNKQGNKKTPTNKIALNKQKEKPMSTKIYNYLSREVMPTVGVGLVGLVVTAGLASYFFGPLGALRRSYDDAMDRQDTGDSIYAINSDEYASGNPDSGQNEEEVFGKFIAGMPANYMPKYVRYYQPQGPQPSYLQGHGPQGHNPQGHQYPNQRRVYGPNNGQPANGPKYNPQQQYFRNRNGAEFPKVSPSPHYNPVQYPQQQPVLRNHQPQPQQPLASPYIQQLHDLQMQKSLSTSIESALKQHGFESETNENYKTIPDEKQADADAPTPEIITTQAPIMVDTNPETSSESESSNQIQRRIAHYVVGSVVSMDSKQQTDEVSSESPPAVASPEIITATHGPRRRRSLRMRRQIEAAEARFLQARQNFDNELSQIDELYKQLQAKINRVNANQSEAQNNTKINKEYKKLEENFELLRLVVSHVKDIERFQKEFYIKSKNWELAMTLKTGMNHIRNEIILVSDLVDHPNDENLIKRIDLRENESVKPDASSGDSVDAMPPTDGPQTHFSPLDDLFKLFQLKALFGFNLLQNIRPSFERAFEEVFRVPAREKLD